ncbi:MAG: hypothetical protein HQM11_02630 [SAR324 cluster bacterium]|nr:hypothetical protein [SAR324 cluster bacterium]
METPRVISQEDALRQQLQTLESELLWRRGPISKLAYYVANIRYIASEHPGKLAIAVFCCLKDLPFNPFDYAINTKNENLTAPEKQKLSLKQGENWFGRFIAYYCSLDSHLLDVYKRKKDAQGIPLAEPDRPTLTGILRDPGSPIFDKIFKDKVPYITFLERKNYGLDLIVKAFPISGQNRELIGIVSFTHDITPYIEQQNMISDSVAQTRNAAEKIFTHTHQMQDIAQEIQKFTADAGLVKNQVGTLIGGVKTLENSLLDLIEELRFLAFNANLQASHSGIAEKRFLVIAREMKSLLDNMMDSIHFLTSVEGQVRQIETDNVSKFQIISDLSQKINTVANNLQAEGENYEKLIETISNAEQSQRRYVQFLTV